MFVDLVELVELVELVHSLQLVIIHSIRLVELVRLVVCIEQLVLSTAWSSRPCSTCVHSVQQLARIISIALCSTHNLLDGGGLLSSVASLLSGSSLLRRRLFRACVFTLCSLDLCVQSSLVQLVKFLELV